MRRNTWCMLGMAAVLALSGCGREDEDVSEIGKVTESPSNEKDATPIPSLTPTNTPTPAPTASPTPTPEPTPIPNPEEKIVEGKNIAPALAVSSLKELYKDYFKIGVGLTGYAPNVMMLTSDAMSQLVDYHFNSATLTNLMKPSYLLNQNASIENAKNGDGKPAVKFDSCIDALEYCKEKGIGMRGHTLVWHTQVPDWFFREGYRSDAGLVDRDTMLMRMESYIEQVLTFTQENYPGVVYCWDVVNEAVEPAAGSHETETGYCIRTRSGDGENYWYTVVGADYVEKAFEYARKYAAEGVKLFYNDYNTFQTTKNMKICALLKDLYAKGLVDGVGMQSYLGKSDPYIRGQAGSVQRAIENFAAIGLEIQLTELTVNIDEPNDKYLLMQSIRYKELMQLLTELDTEGGGPANITSVTFFGLMDEYMLYPDNKEYSRLFDGDLQPKQALYRILDVGEALQ